MASPRNQAANKGVFTGVDGPRFRFQRSGEEVVEGAIVRQIGPFRFGHIDTVGPRKGSDKGRANSELLGRGKDTGGTRKEVLGKQFLQGNEEAQGRCFPGAISESARPFWTSRRMRVYMLFPIVEIPDTGPITARLRLLSCPSRTAPWQTRVWLR